MAKAKIIVGISGASGAVYGVEALKALKIAGVETHLIVSKAAQITLAHECGLSLEKVHALADKAYKAEDLSGSVASGSFKTMGMIVAPCSMKTLAEIATANTSNLLTRAADVILKERRRLVLLTRETPLNAAHLRNMLWVTEMGGIIAPPVPAFYSRPESLEELVKHTVGRALDLFDIEHALVDRWAGIPKKKGKN